jgi:hypothetical protein
LFVSRAYGKASRLADEYRRKTILVQSWLLGERARQEYEEYPELMAR